MDKLTFGIAIFFLFGNTPFLKIVYSYRTTNFIHTELTKPLKKPHPLDKNFHVGVNFDASLSSFLYKEIFFHPPLSLSLSLSVSVLVLFVFCFFFYGVLGLSHISFFGDLFFDYYIKKIDSD